jgi:hypothetical protein
MLDRLRRDRVVRDFEMQVYGPDREIRDVPGTFSLTEYEGNEAILG